MEITKTRNGPITDVAVAGRLDGYWADHLSRTLDEILREGARRIRLDLSATTYVSSMGLRVLIEYYKKLDAIQGKFMVVEPSPIARKVIGVTGLDRLLYGTEDDWNAASLSGTLRFLNRASSSYAVQEETRGGSMTLTPAGDPSLLAGAGYSKQHARSIEFPAGAVGIGLGAFGTGFDDSSGRFGEFLAAGGAAAYQPTDGGNTADYLVAAGAHAPEVQVLYALVARGAFSHSARFDATPEAGQVGLGAIAADCLDIVKASAAVIVMIAETKGLVGAALRRSPTGAAGRVFDFPEVRTWLSFAPEPVHTHALALVAGVVAKGPVGGAEAFLRPMGGLQAHFHACVFPYRPLKRGHLDLSGTVRGLFEGERAAGVLHLIEDNRDGSGAGESEFFRGTCWVAPIRGEKGERS